MQLEGAIDRMYGKKLPKIAEYDEAALAVPVTDLNLINYLGAWKDAVLINER